MCFGANNKVRGCVRFLKEEIQANPINANSLLPGAITVLVELPGAVARLVLDPGHALALAALAPLRAVPAPPDAAELLLDDQLVAARLHLLPLGPAVGHVGADLDEGHVPELGRVGLPEPVEVEGALAEVVAHGLGVRLLVGHEARVAAVEWLRAVFVQLRAEKNPFKTSTARRL